MSDDNYILSSTEIDDNHLVMYDRPTIRVDRKKKLYKKYYNSKWANLKLFLQEQKSLETSVKLQKQKTIEQFSSKCKEIYNTKIKMQLIKKKNLLMFKSYNSNNESIKDKDIINVVKKLSSFNINDISSEFMYESVKKFLFYFRQNNDLMLRLLECIDNKQYEILVPFLCHFFYENFYMESTEQEEILYIIYLLLEKEIDSLYTPSVSTFLDKSFLSKFLTEMGNRYEIKHYLDIILNYLIMNIEELNINYNSLDIIGHKVKHNNHEYYDMSNEENDLHKSTMIKKNELELIKSSSSEINDNIINNQLISKSLNSPPTLLKNSTVNLNTIGTLNSINEFIIVPSSKSNKNGSLKREINGDLFNNIDATFLRGKLENEKNDIMKHFYVRQLRKLQASKNQNLFNGEVFYQKMKSKKRIYKCSVEQFNKSYNMIINFINELLTNLENDSIVPYSIKVICKFIYILLKKRFRNIAKIQCNILICQFLFDKLIFPVLQNPDINDAGKEMIISFNTRKSLSNIYVVCKKLVRGELFSIEDKDYLVIFNKFIINNYHRINKIIDKLIHVKAPEKLMKLSEEFYNTDDFNLDEINRNQESFKYEYFKENPNDFMQHKSICFSIDEFNVFYDIVLNNKERFLQEGSDFKKNFEILCENKDNLTNDNNQYFLIISDEYEDEIKELLNHREKTIALGKAHNTDDIIKNIKYCISHLISKIEISPNWKWVNNDSNTETIFQFIHKYLTSKHTDFHNLIKKEEKNKNEIPLTWYSLYIIQNIKKIKNDWCINDYEKLYESLEYEIVTQLKKLRRLNDFLTVNMGTKFLLIDHKIKIFNQELYDAKKTELNIKILQFIEKTKIPVCLTTIDELYKLSKTYPALLESITNDSPYQLVLSRRTPFPCIHKQKLEKRFYDKEKQLFLHSNNINQFCEHLAEYYKIAYEDIMGISGEKQNKALPKSLTTKSLKKRHSIIVEVIKGKSTKEIIEIYLNYLFEEIKESTIFNEYSYSNSEKDDDKQKALLVIRNYILKALCIKICENEKLNNLFKDKERPFRALCKKISWINPEQLDINKEVFDQQLFKKVEYHIKKMDSLRTPGGMLDQFGLAVQLINSMFIFMLNQKQAEAGDLLPLIIYGVILSRPKRMIFNNRFTKYFLSNNELLGNVGYNSTQAESSINFIQNIKGNTVKMEEKEFENKCKLNIQTMKENKKLKDIQSINETEDLSSDDDII
jgi:hypothetical protein